MHVYNDELRGWVDWFIDQQVNFIFYLGKTHETWNNIW